MVVIRRPRDGAFLVSSDVDAAGNVYERPLGGHVEFGELAADTARREIGEELGQQLRDLRLIEVLENIFVLDGVQTHEVVFLYEAGFADERAYESDEQVIRDDPSGRIRVRWRDPNLMAPRLVPDGIGKVIRSLPAP